MTEMTASGCKKLLTALMLINNSSPRHSYKNQIEKEEKETLQKCTHIKKVKKHNAPMYLYKHYCVHFNTITGCIICVTTKPPHC